MLSIEFPTFQLVKGNEQKKIKILVCGREEESSKVKKLQKDREREL